MFRVVLLSVVAVAALASSGARADIRSEMSRQEFRAMGLDKLSDEELAALSLWIEQRSDSPRTQPVAPIPPAPAQPAAPPVVESQPLSPADPESLPEPPPGYEYRRIDEPDEKSRRDDKEPEVIRAAIKGEFDGWDDRTVFVLDNGQVWRQRTTGRYRYQGPQPVEVEIRRGFLGFYRLHILGTDRNVGVKRLD